MKNAPTKLSPIRKKFNEFYEGLSESEIQKEMLFSQKIGNQKLEKIRANTSILIWCLIVIPIVIGFISAIVIAEMER